MKIAAAGFLVTLAIAMIPYTPNFVVEKSERINSLLTQRQLAQKNLSNYGVLCEAANISVEAMKDEAGGETYKIKSLGKNAEYACAMLVKTEEDLRMVNREIRNLGYLK